MSGVANNQTSGAVGRTLTYGTQAGAVRHVGQMMTLMALLRMVEAYERLHRIRFDWVVRSRPDLLIFAPIQPHCFYTEEQTAYVDHLTTDMLLIMRRKLAPPLLSVVDHYRNCSGVAWWQARMEALIKGAAERAGAQYKAVAGTPIGVARAYPCSEECDTRHTLWNEARLAAARGVPPPPPSGAQTTDCAIRAFEPRGQQGASTAMSSQPKCTRRLSADPGETCLFGGVASCVMRVAKLCKALLTSERLMLAESGAMIVPDSMAVVAPNVTVKAYVPNAANRELMLSGKVSTASMLPSENVLLAIVRGELFREGGTHSHSQLGRNSTPSPSEVDAQTDALRRIVDFVRAPAERAGWRWKLLVDVVANKARADPVVTSFLCITGWGTYPPGE